MTVVLDKFAMRHRSFPPFCRSLFLRFLLFAFHRRRRHRVYALNVPLLADRRRQLLNTGTGRIVCCLLDCATRFEYKLFTKQKAATERKYV